MQNQSKAYFLASFVILFWATAASAFKFSLRFLNTIDLLFFSSLTASIVLFFVLIFSNKIADIRSYSIRDLGISTLLGILNPFLYYLILFQAYSLLPGQMAQPLNFVWPITTVLLSIPILKQKIGFKSISAILISFLGVIIISTKGRFDLINLESPLGISLALGSSVIWALFFLLNARSEKNEIITLFISFLTGTIVILILFIPQLTKPEIEGLLGAIYIGVFEMAISFLLWIKALKLSTTTAQVSNLVYLTPFLALVFLRIFIGEKILISTVIGSILIISGIIYQRYLEEKT